MRSPRVVLTLQQLRLLFGAIAAIFLALLFFLTSAPDLSRCRQYFSPTHQLRPPSTEVAIGRPGDPIDFLPIPEAEQFCQNRRWETWQDRSKPRKIYDLAFFHTELDWLEIRLGQMYDYVDYFIIVEAGLTFQDAPKPLFVRENWYRFERYHSKMIVYTLNTDGVVFQDMWHREPFSRNAMYDQVMPYLIGPQAPALGDVILVSDVDELPRPSTLTALRNCVFPQKLSLHSAMYYYSFQWAFRGDRPYPQATFYEGNATVLPHDLRETASAHLYKAAWHCRYCFLTMGEVLSKMKDLLHSERNLDHFKDPQQTLWRVRHGIDMYEQSVLTCCTIE